MLNIIATRIFVIDEFIIFDVSWALRVHLKSSVILFNWLFHNLTALGSSGQALRIRDGRARNHLAATNLEIDAKVFFSTSKKRVRAFQTRFRDHVRISRTHLD